MFAFESVNDGRELLFKSVHGRIGFFVHHLAIDVVTTKSRMPDAGNAVQVSSVAPDLGELLEIMGDMCSNDATLLW